MTCHKAYIGLMSLVFLNWHEPAAQAQDMYSSFTMHPIHYRCLVMVSQQTKLTVPCRVTNRDVWLKWLPACADSCKLGPSYTVLEVLSAEDVLYVATPFLRHRAT